MIRLNEDVVRFLQQHHVMIVTTIDKTGLPHNSCKGLVDISANRIYLLDLYRAHTWVNLKHNGHIAVTVIDEHKFRGYCIKGKAKIIKKSQLKPKIIKAWEKKIAQRITKRILKNISADGAHQHHPEVFLPEPEYMIVMEPQSVVDLTPHKIKNMKKE